MRYNNYYRGNKYSNKKIEYQGKKFDSKKELRFYCVLEDLQEAGIIKDLKTQVPFEIQPKFKDSEGKTIRAIKYIADFTCIVCDVERFKRAVGQDLKLKKGDLAVLDTKGYKTDVYKLKYKMMLYHGYKIIEI